MLRPKSIRWRSGDVCQNCASRAEATRRTLQRATQLSAYAGYVSRETVEARAAEEKLVSLGWEPDVREVTVVRRPARQEPKAPPCPTQQT